MKKKKNNTRSKISVRSNRGLVVGRVQNYLYLGGLRNIAPFVRSIVDQDRNGPLKCGHDGRDRRKTYTAIRYNIIVVLCRVRT